MADEQTVTEDMADVFKSSWSCSTTIFLLLIAIVILASRSRTFTFFARYYALYLSYLLFGIFVIPLCLLNPGSPENARLLIKYGEHIQLPLCRLRVRRTGCSYPEGPCVIVSNHQSSLDSPIMMHQDIWPGNCVVIMKRIMKYTGPFGLVLILSGTIFVDRKNSASATEMLQSAADAIQENKYRVWIFPEGTRRLMTRKRSEEHLLPFKKGAFNLAVLSQVPIVPVIFSPQEKYFNYKERIFQPGNVTAKVLPPISTAGLTLDDVPRLSDEVRSKMMDAFLNQENGHANSLESDESNIN